MSLSKRVTTEIRGHLLLIGLNRPDKLNAADLSMLHELALAFGELDRNSEIRVGVVFAHGDNFTAGLDLNDLGPAMMAGTLQLVPEGGLDPWGISTRQVSKPVVIAVQGICYTLGIELALAADIVIAADNCRFAQLEVSRGILPFGGATLRFPKVAGHSNAMRYLLTGDEFNSADALRLGMVAEVVAAGSELERAIQLAEVIAAQAPLAVQQTLASARNPDQQAEKTEVFKRLAALLKTRDVQRGMQAFATKQPAVFEGD